MKKRKISPLLFLVSIVIFTLSCNKTDNSQSQENETQLLNSYISTNNITVTPTTSGLYIIPKKEGTGETPQTGDFVLLNYSAKWLSTGQMFDTNDTTKANSNSINMFQPLGGPFKFVIGSSIWGIGMSEGIHSMKEGGISQFIIPSILWNSDFYTRIYDVELLKVFKDPFAFEQQQIGYYLDSISTVLQKTPKLTTADSTKVGTSGVYYIETLKGTGDSIVDGKTVTVAYSGSLLPYKGLCKERKFGSSASLQIILNNTSAILGFAEGIRHMRKGGKAIVVIPYHKGYGADLQAYYSQIIIPQYSTLVYTLEIIDVN
jgi:FKBP-type peptidyl-prolyl cis-trans isomerase